MNTTECLSNLKHIRDMAITVSTLFLSTQGFIVTTEVDKMEDMARMAYAQQVACSHSPYLPQVSNHQFHSSPVPKMYAIPQQASEPQEYLRPQMVQQASVPQSSYSEPPKLK